MISSAFGKVYKAKHRKTGNLVAIKEMYIGNNEKMRKSAEVEAKTMGGCDCEYVITIHDYKIIRSVAYVLVDLNFYL